ncbi:MAG: adenosylcobinamide-GDP ribazoletransferase [Pseudoruegeria sp.]
MTHSRPQSFDILTALGLLTRLPIGGDSTHAQERGAHAAWSFPIVGAFIGCCLATVAAVLTWLGHSPLVQASAVLIAQAFLTGAMHEDGLADTVDGFWGGWTPNRRLEIMKDSMIGTYGVLALCFSMLLRWGALWALCDTGSILWVLIAVGAMSRAPMVGFMAWMPTARRTGLSASVGRPDNQTAWIAILLAAGIGLTCLGWIAFSAVFWVTVGSGILASIAHRKINGQTGDVLGASQQISEIILLVTLASVF